MECILKFDTLGILYWQTSDNHQFSAARGATNLVGKFNFGVGGCIDDH